MNSRQSAVAFIASLLAAGPFNFAYAQATPRQSTVAGTPTAVQPGTALVDGEVRKIDKDAKITLKHAEIPNLEMPAMTMVFQVRDPAMLDAVKVGDKVKFQAQKIAGAIVLTDLQRVIQASEPAK